MSNSDNAYGFYHYMGHEPMGHEPLLLAPEITRRIGNKWWGGCEGPKHGTLKALLVEVQQDLESGVASATFLTSPRSKGRSARDDKTGLHGQRTLLAIVHPGVWTSVLYTFTDEGAEANPRCRIERFDIPTPRWGAPMMMQEV